MSAIKNILIYFHSYCSLQAIWGLSYILRIRGVEQFQETGSLSPGERHNIFNSKFSIQWGVTEALISPARAMLPFLCLNYWTIARNSNLNHEERLVYRQVYKPKVFHPKTSYQGLYSIWGRIFNFVGYLVHLGN